MSQSTQAPETAALRVGGQPLAAAKAPIGPGAISFVGLLLGAVVVALGLVALHDAAAAAGWLSGGSWIEALVDRLDGMGPGSWLVPVGVVLVFLGLWLLLTALRPRPRKAVAVSAQTGVFLRPRDIAKLARDAADGVDGVTSAKASASLSKVVVSVDALSKDGISEQVSQAVNRRLEALVRPPAVRVVVTAEAGSR